MSRIANRPIIVPEGVELTLTDSVVRASNINGVLECDLDSRYAKYFHVDDQVTLKPIDDSKKARSLSGLYRSNIINMIIGLTRGYRKIMEITGVGYKASVVSNFNFLILSLGFSHEVILKIPDGISVSCQKGTIDIVGADKLKVSMFAAKLFDLKRPEPYKGSGISYKGMYILRKQGKRK